MSQDHCSSISIKNIESVLPQTQCRKCGYEGCHPYAEAITRGESINRCTPGGQSVINSLATLLDKPATSLHPDHLPDMAPHTVTIQEELCIGCTKCIQACPMDAIIGSAKQMHTVITQDCTGCDLCIPPCPVDCIETIPVNTKAAKEMLTPERLHKNRYLFERRKTRLANRKQSQTPISRKTSGDRRNQRKTMAFRKTKGHNSLVLKALNTKIEKLYSQYHTTRDTMQKNTLLQQIEKMEKHVARMKDSSLTL